MATENHIADDRKKVRLIDANALITYFEEQCDIATKDTEKESLYVLAALKCCIDLFQNFPTVDAAEVVHGQWDAVFEYEDFQYAHCSVCGKRSEYMTKFCPNCGAKMDGDGNGC